MPSESLVGNDPVLPAGDFHGLAEGIGTAEFVANVKINQQRGREGCSSSIELNVPPYIRTE